MEPPGTRYRDEERKAGGNDSDGAHCYGDCGGCDNNSTDAKAGQR